jgi:hypothetical protein
MRLGSERDKADAVPSDHGDKLANDGYRASALNRSDYT